MTFLDLRTLRSRHLFTFAKKWQGVMTYSAGEKHSGHSCGITDKYNFLSKKKNGVSEQNGV